MRFITVASIPMPLNFELLIIAVGIAYVAVTIVLQRKLVNPMRQQELQDKIRTISNDLSALIKTNATKEEIAKKQSEVTPLMMESMKMSFKPMLVIFPLFLIVWLVALPAAFNSYSAYTVNFIETLHYKGLFFVTSLLLGVSVSMVLMVIDRNTHKKRKMAAAAAEPSQGRENTQTGKITS